MSVELAYFPPAFANGVVEVLRARTDDGAVDGVARAILGEDDEVGVVARLVQTSGHCQLMLLENRSGVSPCQRAQ